LASLANGYVKNSGGAPSIVAVPIPLADGGTGATVASTARANLGVGTVGTVNLSGDGTQFLTGAGTWVTGTPGQVPSGMIAIFTTACPAGWTRVAAWDGLMIRANTAYGATGGATTHTHSVSGSVASHAHGAGTLTGPQHAHGNNTGATSVTTDVAGSHNHNIGANYSITVNPNSQFASAYGTGNMSSVASNHSHSASGAGSTDNFGDHQHTQPSHTHSIAADGNLPVTGSTDAQAPAWSGTVAAASSYPPFVDVVLCQKN
jgi:hypothetical protein